VAEVRRRIRATMVPTADADVRRLLRQVEQPVTLFGEREVRSPAAPAARQGRLSFGVLFTAAVAGLPVSLVLLAECPQLPTRSRCPVLHFTPTKHCQHPAGGWHGGLPNSSRGVSALRRSTASSASAVFARLAWPHQAAGSAMHLAVPALCSHLHCPAYCLSCSVPRAEARPVQMERRDRLRKVLAMMDEDDREAVLGAAPPLGPPAPAASADVPA